jgi:aspartyl/asparaginyl beta-hydroxylase (cupin superfamily)
MATTPDLTGQADRAAAAGDLAAARSMLEGLCGTAPNFESWMKLGSICRALGDVPAALAAIHKALEYSPLDFMALLSRAMLLEQSGHGDADEAYGRALAQRPSGALPPQLAKMVGHAEQRHASHLAQRGQGLSTLLSPALATAAPAESARIERFRTNTLRTTRPYHSEPTHFHFPGLVEQEFHDRETFPWLEKLEAATDDIAAECARVMAAERAELVPYIQYAAHEPLAQWRELNHSRDWTAIHLLQNGEAVLANARHCPQTMALLAELPQPDVPGCSPNAMFSLLAPHTTIPPHTGVTNTRLVCHLPLIVPQGCWFRVGADTRPWERGKAWVFDDTIEHEAANPSGELRINLIVDVWHPGLSAVERDAVTRLLAAEAGQASLAL